MMGFLQQLTKLASVRLWKPAARMGARFGPVMISLMVLAGLIAPGLAMPTAATAAGNPWSEPEDISGPYTTSGWFFPWQRVAAAPDGTVHAVWHQSSAESLDVFYAYRPPNGEWSEPVNVSNVADKNGLWPDIAVGPEGTVHIVWSDTRQTKTHIAYRQLSGSTWTPSLSSEPTWLTSGPDIGYGLPVVCTSSDGTVHVAYEETATPGNVFYRSKTLTGGWSVAFNVSNDARMSARPAIASGPDGAIHLVWMDSATDSSDRRYLYRRKSPAGTWAALPGLVVSERSTYGVLLAPRSVVDKDNTLHIVWESGNAIFHRARSGSGTWQAVDTICPATTDSSLADVAADAAGNIHVVWTTTWDSENVIAYSRKSYGSASWSDPISVATSNVSWGAVAAGGGIHVVWYQWDGATRRTMYAMAGSHRPAAESPSGGAPAGPAMLLEASAFSAAGQTLHEAAQWQITGTAGDYSSPVWDSGTDATNLTATSMPVDDLDHGTTYYWRVRYLDSFGVWSAFSEESSFVFDTDGPVKQLTGQPGAYTSNNTPTFTGTASDEHASITLIEYRIDGGDWIEVSFDPVDGDPKNAAYTFTTAVLADGVHTVHVRSTDSAGNISNVVIAEFTVDTAPPAAGMDTFDAYTSNNTVTFTGSVSSDSSPIDSIQYRYRDAGDDEWSDWMEADTEIVGNPTVTYTFTIDGLEDGKYTVQVRCIDSAGNITELDPVEFTVDTQEPVFLTEQTTLVRGGAFPKITGTITDTGSTIALIEYRINGGDWYKTSFYVDPEDPAKYSFVVETFLLPGLHNIDIRATDAAGNLVQTGFSDINVGKGGLHPAVIVLISLAAIGAIAGAVYFLVIRRGLLRRKPKETPAGA